MTNWNGVPELPAIITTASRESIGSEGLSYQLIETVVATGANLVVYVPFYLPRPAVAKRLFIVNGTTVNNNIDLGIYDDKLSLLVSTGSTAQGLASILKIVDITDTQLPAGRYYFAYQHSSTGGVRGLSYQTQPARMAGVAQHEVGSFGLPATAVPAAYAVSNTVPNIGVELGRVV